MFGNCQKRFDKTKKKVAAKKVVEEGFQMCKHCLHVKPNTDFQSKFHRRNKMTSKCTQCRSSQSKTVKKRPQKEGSVVRFGKIGKRARMR